MAEKSLKIDVIIEANGAVTTLKNLDDAMARLSDRSLTKVATGVSTVDKELAKLQKSIDKTVDAQERQNRSTQNLVMHLAKFVSAGAVLGAIKATGQWADKLEDLSQSTNLSIGFLQKLDRAANLNNSSLDKLSSTALRLQQRIGGASSGTVAAVQKLGLSFDAIHDAAPERQLRDIVLAISKIDHPADSARAKLALLGETGAKDFPALLAAIQDTTEGTEDLVIAASGLENAWTKTKAAGQQLLLTIFAPMGPVLDGIATMFLKVADASAQGAQIIFNNWKVAWNAIRGKFDTSGAPALPNKPLAITTPLGGGLKDGVLFGADGQAIGTEGDVIGQMNSGLRETTRLTKSAADHAERMAAAFARTASDSANALALRKFPDLISTSHGSAWDDFMNGGALPMAFYSGAQRTALAGMRGGFESQFLLPSSTVATLGQAYGFTETMPQLRNAPGFLGNFGSMFGGGISQTVLGALMGGGNVGQSVAGLAGNAVWQSLLGTKAVGGMISSGLTALGGLSSTLMSSVASIIPAIGPLIGPLISKLFGKLFGPSKAELANDDRDAFIGQFGGGGTGIGSGFHNLAAKLTEATGEAGGGRLFQQLISADTPDKLKAAIAGVTAELDRYAKVTAEATLKEQQHAASLEATKTKFDEKIAGIKGQLKDLDQQWADWDALEAPEAVMGVVERRAREKIELQRHQLQQDLQKVEAEQGAALSALETAGTTAADTVGSAFVSAFDRVVDAAKIAAIKIEDILEGRTYTIRPTIEVPEVTALDAPSGYAEGGAVQPRYLAGGGWMPRGTDTVPAMLTPGEFVLRKSAVERIGVGTLNAMNQGEGTATVHNYFDIRAVDAKSFQDFLRDSKNQRAVVNATIAAVDQNNDGSLSRFKALVKRANAAGR